MDRIVRLVETVSKLFARLAGGLILLSALLISLDVIFRSAFRSNLFESFELSGYAFAIATAFGLAWALVTRAHVRIEVIYNALGPRPRAWLDVLSLAVLAAVAVVAAWWCAGVVLENLHMGARSNTTLAVPLALPQSLWWLGLAWFAGCAVLLFAVALRGVLTGRHLRVQAMFGVASVQEEIDASGGDAPREPVQGGGGARAC